MRRNYLFILIIILGATLFSSCEKDVTFEFNKPAKLSLNCILNPDSTITARLTLSKNIENTTTFQPVDDAIIVLYENGTELDTLAPVGEGNYYLNYYPEPLSEYEITVMHPDFETLNASTTVPQKPNVSHQPDTIEYTEQGRFFWLDVYYEIHDIPGPNSYWLYWKHTLHGVTYAGGSASMIQAPFIDDFNRQIDTEEEYGIWYNYYVRISDVGYDGEILAFNKSSKTGSFYNVVSADEHYDKYIKSSVEVRLNSEYDLPFKEPVQIYSNIENGYGIFGSCAITTIKL
ncbi:protein of unknown function [Tangfeifania diversioriginum]|uniref:DUF4249 domain-containing protein n=1 Tax=Tangfeifania diversioriginum TaxID=1168035 RepID=A0A1M6JI75_9BACT|nr:DUF4249 domain-containing protein [Tangfeifania diversioriginum]SHJ46355.1 protein of unknown function [Tangfeifania diversioriginum]